MNSVPIFYQITGDGIPVVLIHGGFSDGPLTWGVQMVELSAAYRLVIVDRRGHGKSPREPRPYSIASDACDVAAVLTAQGLSQFHVVGHSYGSLVALELASMLPEQILSLHMIEPPYLSLLPGDPDVQILIEQGTTIFAAAADMSADEITTKFFTTILGGEGVNRLRTRPAWQALVKEAKAEAHAQFPATYPPEKARDLRLHVPVQVYCGENSHPGMQKLAKVTAAAIPGAVLIQIPSAGHDLQRTVEFNKVLREKLQKA